MSSLKIGIVFPNEFKQVAHYIRLKRLVESEEYLVAWYTNGKFDDAKSYYTTDYQDAKDTFISMQQSVFFANR